MALLEPSVIVKSDKVVVVMPTGRQYSAQKGHVNFDQIIDRVKKRVFAGIEDLFDIPTAVKTFSKGTIEIKGETVYYLGAPMHNALTKRMLAMFREGFDISPLIAFTENLMDNPSKTAVEELYLFLESNELPITPDGYFLAYKNVRKDFKDHHSGKIDNSVGAKPSMPRNAVDDKRDVTCSHGLHFCSLAYLRSFHADNSVTVIVKINPRDVVSIPSDYNNTKGRCCAYEVVGIHEKYTASAPVEAFNKPVVSDYSKPAPKAEAPKATNTAVDQAKVAYERGKEQGTEDALKGLGADDYNEYRKAEYAAEFKRGYKDGYGVGLSAQKPVASATSSVVKAQNKPKVSEHEANAYREGYKEGSSHLHRDSFYDDSNGYRKLEYANAYVAGYKDGYYSRPRKF